MAQLIMVEGIPGSGKTTYSLRLEKYFNENNKNAKCYLEGDRHPADLAWCAVLNDNEYNSILEKYPAYTEKIEKFSFREDSNIILPYIDLDIAGEDKALWDYLEDKEILSGKYRTDEFLDINMKRWNTFCSDSLGKDEVIIFESVFYQNHVNELLLYQDEEYGTILKYMNSLLKTVLPLDPVLVYLNQKNVRKTIEEVAKKRKSNKEGFPDWIDRVSEYIENTPFGSKCSSKGADCFIEFLEIRNSLEIKLFHDMNVRKLLIEDSSLDYEIGFNKLIYFFK